MKIIEKTAHARAGLMGNPSDGYGGRTVALIIRDFAARVVLYEWDELEVLLSQEDQSRFQSVEDLVRDVKHHGYYGGIRLVKATIKKFADYCRRQGHTLHDQNFSIRYQSDIPRQVGMGGSSAIIVATLRCLMEFYDIEIPLPVQPSLALSIETEELGIPAGLQDRVIQVYEGVVAMDFSDSASQQIEGYTCGTYEPLDPRQLPPIYLAFKADVGEPTEVMHNDLRARYEQGDTEVVAAMDTFADLARQARDVISLGRGDELAPLINANYDLRDAICQISPWQVEMIRTARDAGATAKFAGSGGAIVGTCDNGANYSRLEERLTAIGCRVLRPTVVG